MKKSLLLTFAISILGIHLFAQKISIRTNESNENFSSGKHPALSVIIYDAKPSDIESEWKSLMKGYKAKTKESKDEMFSDNAIISDINGNNSIDVYAKAVKGKDNEVKFFAAFDLGGAYISESHDKSKYNMAKKIVNDFALKMTREAITGQRKAAEKVLGDLQDDQKDLEKENSKLNSNIEDYKKKIEDYNNKIKQAQDDLVKNKGEQDKKKAEIQAQDKVVKDVTAKENSVD